MSKPLKLNPDRLCPADPTTRMIARQLYQQIAQLPIISPQDLTYRPVKQAYRL